MEAQRGDTPLLILDKLDIIGHPEEAEVEVEQLLLLNLGPPQLGTHVPKSVSDYLLSVKEKVVNKMNYVQILEERPLEQIVRRIFFWRVFVRFAICKSSSVQEKQELKDQLLPPLRPLCEFVHSVIDIFAVEYGDRPGGNAPYLVQAIRDLLDLLRWAEHDVMGLHHHRYLLTYILSSEYMPYDERIIEHSVHQLFAYHYPNTDDVQAAVLEISSCLELIVQRDPNSIDEVTQGTETRKVATGECLKHCLTMIHSMMKTSRIRTRSEPALDGLFEIVDDARMNENREIRRIAFKCSMLMALSDPTFLPLITNQLRVALVFEVPENMVSVIEGVSDLVMRYGYSFVAKSVGVFDEQGKRMRLAARCALVVYEKFFQDDDVAQEYAHSLGKWMMQEYSPEWSEPLARMLILCCNPDSEEKALPIKKFLLYFLRTYAAMGYFAKLSIANATFEAAHIMSELHRLNRSCAIHADDIIDLIVKYTRERHGNKVEIPTMDPLDNVAPVHVYLMGRTLRTLLDYPDHKQFNSLARLLSLLKLDGLKPEMAEKCDWPEQMKLIIEGFGSDRARARQFVKSALCNINERFRTGKGTRRRGKTKKDGLPSEAAVEAVTGSLGLSTIAEEEEPAEVLNDSGSDYEATHSSACRRAAGSLAEPNLARRNPRRNCKDVTLSYGDSEHDTTDETSEAMNKGKRKSAGDCRSESHSSKRLCAEKLDIDQKQTKGWTAEGLTIEEKVRVAVKRHRANERYMDSVLELEYAKSEAKELEEKLEKVTQQLQQFREQKRLNGESYSESSTEDVEEKEKLDEDEDDLEEEDDFESEEESDDEQYEPCHDSDSD
ncbi:hypothetical protein QR680_008881 [Steinernema hermaphroditum]|uniref:Nuclear condensin complex subunit 3 C-terminal domain-containing protein n=1 Tax=Steinernema hermaphroditum TaxID=289476 RepID=A0AA39II89_9BILA|nr:hypothetical protein QR680_008881 [Steinernema hermaphroditum]